MRKAALIGALLITGCGSTAPKAIDCPALIADEAVIERCFGGDISNEYVGDEKCFPFSEEREYEGILITGFEWSEFYPHIASYEEADRENPVYWFEEMPGSFGKIIKDQEKCTYDCAFRVRFVGRESLCDAYFGHLGSYPKKVIAARNGQRQQLHLPKD
jgi:hypothetical protein